MKLYRETPCEHGEMASHTWFTPKTRLVRECPGGSREEVTIDYESAVEVAENHRPGVGPVTDRKRVRAIVDAALRVTKDVR